MGHRAHPSGWGPLHDGPMRARRDDQPNPTRIPASRAVAVAGTLLWDITTETAVPAAVASPSQIRALAFAASLGPARPPFSTDGPELDDELIDLAGEEALLGYLAT